MTAPAKLQSAGWISALASITAPTPRAGVNYTVPANQLVCGDEAAVYADKGYAKRARSAWPRSLGIKPRIMHKSWGGGPPFTACSGGTTG